MLRVALLLFSLPCLITAAAVVVSSPDSVAAAAAADQTPRTARNDDPSAAGPLEYCLSQQYSEIPNCFGVKAVAILDRASRMHRIDLLPGITFVADSDEVRHRSAKALMTEQEIENSISEQPTDKSTKLMNMVFDSVANFFQTHSLQLRIPKSASADLQNALTEGRAKIKKKFLPYIGIIAVKIFALLPLLLGFVGFLALKALIVGKIALIIAAILAFQKYSYGSGGLGGFGKLSDSYSNAASSYSPVNSPGGYYKRSMEDQAASQHLAFSAQLPQQISHS